MLLNDNQKAVIICHRLPSSIGLGPCNECNNFVQQKRCSFFVQHSFYDRCSELREGEYCISVGAGYFERGLDVEVKDVPNLGQIKTPRIDHFGIVHPELSPEDMILTEEQEASISMALFPSRRPEFIDQMLQKGEEMADPAASMDWHMGYIDPPEEKDYAIAIDDTGNSKKFIKLVEFVANQIAEAGGCKEIHPSPVVNRGDWTISISRLIEYWQSGRAFYHEIVDMYMDVENKKLYDLRGYPAYLSDSQFKVVQEVPFKNINGHECMMDS